MSADLKDDCAADSARDLRVFVTSWNMGNAAPPSDMTSWLPKNGGGYDIIAIGLQESTFTMKDASSSSAESSLDSPDNAEPQEKILVSRNSKVGAKFRCVEAVKQGIEDALGSDYFLVDHNRRAQMQLFVYCTSSLRQSVTEVEYSSENTGFMSIMPNKGGISVMMRVFGTRIAFVSCHLAAHEGLKNCLLRNANCSEILGGIRSGRHEDLDLTAHFHHIFWMGDMNYRIEFESPGNLESESALLSAEVKESNDSTGPKTTDSNGKASPAADVTLSPREVTGSPREVTGPVSSSVSPAESKDEGDGVEQQVLPSIKIRDIQLSDATTTSPAADEQKAALRKQRESIVLDHIKNENWPALLELDELGREIRAGRVLSNFSAPVPVSNPSFKRKRHVGIPPSSSAERAAVNIIDFYDMKRMPSFTDRVLHCSLPGFAADLVPMNLRLVDGGLLHNEAGGHTDKEIGSSDTDTTTAGTLVCLEAPDTSDHKPVVAAYRLCTRGGSGAIMVPEHAANVKESKLASEPGCVTHIKVKNIKASNLTAMDHAAAGGLSDPYVRASMDPEEVLLAKISKRQTKVIFNNLNPDWDKEELDIKILGSDVSGLSREAHLILSVWDHDVVHVASKRRDRERAMTHDLIGSVAIPLAWLFRLDEQEGDKEKTFDFSLPLLRNGLRNGTLSGSVVWVRPPSSASSPPPPLRDDECISVAEYRLRRTAPPVECMPCSMS